MIYLGIFLLLVANTAFALEFSSGDTKATVVELYTSEGCSSCPPADKWLSTLKDDERLFKNVIPMAFHVDYWDQLGWKDRFAKAEFSDRQRLLAMNDATSSVFVGLFSQVYTPAFLVAGQEWPRWHNYKTLPKIESVKAGVISAKLEGQSLSVTYSEKGDYELNIAYLGMELVSKVTAGENRSLTLKHDFVVLSHLQKEGASSWEVNLPAIPNQGQKQTAISIWITKPDSLYIKQAAATFIGE